MPSTPLSAIEIDRERLRGNLKYIRSLLQPNQQLIGVIKANAYGHGLTTMAPLLEDLVDAYQVDDIEELIALRSLSSKPTLVLGYVGASDLPLAIHNRGIIACFDLHHCNELEQLAGTLGQQLPIVIALDAEFGREGSLPSEADAIFHRVSLSPWLVLNGIYAHYSCSDDLSAFGQGRTKVQRTVFERFITEHQTPGLVNHIANSSGILTRNDSPQSCAAARVGIALYGLTPGGEVIGRLPELQPIVRWVTHVAQVKELPAQSPIGYGASLWSYQPIKIALIPQGYSDGLNRRLSNGGEVLIHSTRCPILGRISMNMCVIDVTHLASVAPGDEVVLLGKQGTEEITAEERAKQLGTINYEIITSLGSHLPRRVVG